MRIVLRKNRRSLLCVRLIIKICLFEDKSIYFYLLLRAWLVYRSSMCMRHKERRVEIAYDEPLVNFSEPHAANSKAI